MKINTSLLEIELMKRLKYQYVWGRKQNNEWDSATNFIYKIESFDALISKTESVFHEKYLDNYNRQDFFNYSVNRWYNFNSAKAVEYFFSLSKKVTPHYNPKNKLIDFSINGINFDHKTSVFPQKFPFDISYALNHKKELINWLYQNQSQQGRLHYENRLFLILYDSQKNTGN